MSVGRPKKRKFVIKVTINADSLDPTPERSNVIRCENQQTGPSTVTTLMQTIKAKAIAELSDVIKITNVSKMKTKSKDMDS